MKNRSVRVVLASEHPRALNLLREVVEKEDGVILGEAENAASAVRLTGSLRPDVAIIDSYLPLVVGLDDVPLSRIGGLDAAQAIVERTPGTLVVLINNLDGDRLGSPGAAGAIEAVFAREQKDETVAFTLSELQRREWSDNGVVFANLSVTAQQVETKTGSNLVFGGMFLGGVTMITGWMLIISLWLVPAGVYLAAAGAGILFVSLATKLIFGARRSSRSPGQDRRGLDGLSDSEAADLRRSPGSRDGWKW